MIGNDLVCLKASSRRPAYDWLRFTAKVCTPLERSWIENSRKDPVCQLWTLWAAKESVYKAHYKRSRKRLFAPKKIRLIPSHHGFHFKTGEWVYKVTVKKNSDYIHAWARPLEDLRTVHTGIFPLELQEIGAATEQVREVLLRDIAARLQLEEYELAIQKDVYGVPFVVFNGRSAGIDLSLSHQGCWVAFAYSTRSHVCVL